MTALRKDQLHAVISKDGTRIAGWRTGTGPPLVLVHGTAADHTRWAPLLPELEPRFTVYAMDRRGRGASADAGRYAIEREFEDVAALVDSIGAPADVIAHSYGALCALEGAVRARDLRRLILYEPPFRSDAPIYSTEVMARLESLVESRRREDVVLTFMREVVGMSPRELEAVRTSPAWPARVAAAHTIPRELRGADGYAFEAKRFRALQTPTLLLRGDTSSAFLVAATDRVARALPDARLVVLQGQGHVAMDTATERFLAEVTRFLQS